MNLHITAYRVSAQPFNYDMSVPTQTRVEYYETYQQCLDFLIKIKDYEAPDCEWTVSIEPIQIVRKPKSEPTERYGGRLGGVYDNE
jgi:hypothetical protein